MIEKSEKQQPPVWEKAGIGLIILAVSVLTFKFIAWNSWKITDFTETTRGLMKAPSAVNLSLEQGDTVLLKKSFPYNQRGNYYIVDGFDVAGPLDDPSFKITVNNRTAGDFVRYRFRHFNLLRFEDYAFFFAGPRCDIQDFLKLKQLARGIINHLPRLTLEHMRAERTLIYSLPDQTEIKLQYGKGRVSRAIPAVIPKDRWYELQFRYRVTGAAAPAVMLAPFPFPSGQKHLPVRMPLDGSLRGTWRDASMLFRSGETLDSPGLYLFLGGKRRKGEVSFRNMSLYRYGESGPGPGPAGLAGSRAQVIYMNVLEKIKKEFIDLKYYGERSPHAEI